MVVLFFDKKIPSITLDKGITNKITEEVINGRSEPDSCESDEESYPGIHATCMTLDAYERHRNLRRKWYKSRL